MGLTNGLLRSVLCSAGVDCGKRWWLHLCKQIWVAVVQCDYWLLPVSPSWATECTVSC
jgi:hypothetical protein